MKKWNRHQFLFHVKNSLFAILQLRPMEEILKSLHTLEKETDGLLADISHAVTKGMIPDTPMKFSGIKWVGNIPAYWNIVKLRQILHPVNVKNRPELPLLSVVREQGVILRDVNLFAQASDGIRVGQWDLQMDKMKEIPFIVPPADEQTAIVEYIRRILQKYDIAIKKLSKEVRLLEKYKATFVADAITGKIDVRGIEISEYEFVDEEANTEDSSEKAEGEEEIFNE